MPSSRLFFRIDLVLALTFVAVCAYARRVERRQLAPLVSGPPVGNPIAALSPAPVPKAITVAATSGKAVWVTSRRARGKSTGGAGAIGSIATTSSPTAPAAAAARAARASRPGSVAASTPLTAQFKTQQICGKAGSGSSCSATALDVVAPMGAVASTKVGPSDEEESSNGSFTPIGVGSPPITQLYTDMLGAPVGAGSSSRRGEIYATGSATEPAVGFTPTYPWDSQLGTPFVSNPVPFSITPASNWSPDFSKKDDGPKKLGDGGGNGGNGGNGGSGGKGRGNTGDEGSTNQPPVTATPEPATITMLATGIAALETMRRRRKAIAAA